MSIQEKLKIGNVLRVTVHFKDGSDLIEDVELKDIDKVCFMEKVVEVINMGFKEDLSGNIVFNSSIVRLSEVSYVSIDKIGEMR